MKQYDQVAQEYIELRMRMFKKKYNKELPVMLRLLGDIKNKRILDVGCGSGDYAKLYSKKGAEVIGIDSSVKEIEHARRANSKNTEFFVHDITKKLKFKSGEFDTLTSSLVLDHIKDLKPVFEEFHRVLKKKGIVVFAITNPLFYQERSLVGKKKVFGRKFVFGNYFKRRRVDRTWGGKIVISHYHKLLEDYFSAFLATGFELVEFREPAPLRVRKRDWHSYNPTILVFKIRKK